MHATNILHARLTVQHTAQTALKFETQRASLYVYLLMFGYARRSLCSAHGLTAQPVAAWLTPCSALF